MCIVFWKLNQNPPKGLPIKFIYAGNRDEFFNRPTKPMHYWKDEAVKILAPLDMQPAEEQRGTWFGINEYGRLGFLTNFYEEKFKTPGKKSRGLLVREFLTYGREGVDLFNKEKNIENELDRELPQKEAIRGLNIKDYLEKLSEEADDFDGFNLVVVDLNSMDSYYFTNRHGTSQKYIEKISGEDCHGVSNSLLDRWPKVEKGKKMIEELLETPYITQETFVEEMFKILNNQEPFSVELPPTIPEFRHAICIPKIDSSGEIGADTNLYGTRTSIIVIVDMENNVTVYERQLHSNFQNIVTTDEPHDTVHTFKLNIKPN
ncbi:Transport and Golgi organization-like protein [Zancudomyces culisetae]|uniref:Transport and Golgi organization-like protein n=1 Tax=Zancudomyces culisetae TaxID=1213189 RepID=A0A1R1PKN7_ZANCU|nr:Transport and Golgi organization-like protein [Zancudomyces culisetae]|eukprot:OMH81525.1 Transport and Golgi organization-like protein [Zancudomyces culisetae]